MKDFEGNIHQGIWDINQPRDSIFHRSLRLREKLLIANELKPENVAYLTDNEKQKLEGVLRKIVGLDLKGRDLRYADFSKSLMPKVDFREIKKGAPTQLGHANFHKAKLFKARMIEADLQSADLSDVQLQDASLYNAQLQGANLSSANLQGVNLRSANLQGAHLYETQLQGANLHSAWLQSTNLNDAQLQGANLYNAQLQLANLSGANLQGADLGSAQFQGASLYNAQLQGTNLDRAELQSANLTYADLTLSNLSGALFSNMSEQELGYLFNELKNLLNEMSKTIKNPYLIPYSVLQDQLTKKINKTTFSLAEANGQNIWIEEPDEIVQKLFKDPEASGAFEKSNSDYQNSLAEFLIKLSCQDKWIASGIIHYRTYFSPLQNSFGKCLLSLKDKKNKSGLAVCPGLSAISKKDIEELKRILEIPKNEIPPTFKCEV